MMSYCYVKGVYLLLLIYFTVIMTVLEFLHYFQVKLNQRTKHVLFVLACV